MDSSPQIDHPRGDLMRVDAPDASLAVLRLIAAKTAPKTRQNYRSALSQWEAWLGGQKPTDATLAEYLAYQHEQGKAPSSGNMLVSAVRYWEKEMGRKGEIVGKLTEDTIKGIRREGAGRGRGQVRGLSRDEVAIMANLCSKKETLAGLRDAALLRVMSDGLLRIGEAVAIDCQHLEAHMDGSGTLLIPRSKTDPEGKDRAVQYLTGQTMQAIRAMLQHPRCGYTTGPLFRRIRRGDWVDPEKPMSVEGVRHIIQTAAQAAGIEGASGHSLRIGSAQELAEHGASLVELQKEGRWKDANMPARYTRRQAAGKGAVARIFEGRD